jgi:hypothetical protein
MDAGSLLAEDATACQQQRERSSVEFKSAFVTDPLMRSTEFGERMTVSEKSPLNVPPVRSVLEVYAGGTLTQPVHRDRRFNRDS